jgi:hypothetical protein
MLVKKVVRLCIQQLVLDIDGQSLLKIRLNGFLNSQSLVYITSSIGRLSLRTGFVAEKIRE